MPIIRSGQVEFDYNSILISDQVNWRKKIINTLQTSYGKAPFFKDVFEFVKETIFFPTSKVAEFNINTIYKFAIHFNIDTSKVIMGSSLQVEGSSTDLLIAMVKAVGGTAYMCGGGAKGYQEDDKFPKSGLGLVYQNFRHPVYKQVNTKEFIPGLSIIDCLMNMGFDWVKNELKTAQF
jgi:hypothetical protein